jgi:hypothetical protein
MLLELEELSSGWLLLEELFSSLMLLGLLGLLELELLHSST